jgi:PAS domain S-box-containing protein
MDRADAVSMALRSSLHYERDTSRVDKWNGTSSTGDAMNPLQKQLDAAQQITHIGSWEWDVRTGVIVWSDELYRMYGLEPQSCAITLETFIARVHPGDRERTTREVRAALERGGRFSYPERIVRPDGSVRRLETLGETITDESGKIVGLLGTCRDVTEERERDAQLRLYADMIRHVQIALCVWSVGDPSDPSTFRLLAFNPAAERLAGLRLEGRIGDALPDLLPYARGGQFEGVLTRVARGGGVEEAIVLRSKDPQNPNRAVALKAFPLPDDRVGVAVEDITAMIRARMLREAEHHILQQIAMGVALPAVLDAIAKLVEEHAPPALASILLVDETGTHVRHGAAPSLPAAYIAAIDGAKVGEKAGSCGTAVHRRAPVFVSDIRTDPLWEDYRELADTHGLRACWSVPVFARDGRVLGTFALYYRQVHAPSEDDKSLIARAGEIAGIAMQRYELENQLRDLSAHLEQAREEERSELARELHDVFGQALTALKLDIAWIARRAAASAELPRAELVEKTRSMSELGDRLIADTRRISTELRPGILDVGLLAAFEWQATEFSSRSGTRCDVRSNIGDLVVARDVSTALFRILQEALTNVARHAQATHVVITLERTDGELRLDVRDDGVGISADQAEGAHSLGLLGIRERVRRLGGAVTIAGEPDNGTLVAVTVPLRHA